MEYQETINLLGNTLNQSKKSMTKNWVEINDDACGTYNTNTPIKFKTSMLRSRLCDHSDAYILVKGTIIVTNTGTSAAPSNRNKNVIFNNCAPFTDYTSETSNAEIDHAKDIDVATAMYNLIDYSGNYLETSGSLWQYYRDKPNINNDCNITDFTNDPDSFSFKQKKILK